MKPEQPRASTRDAQAGWDDDALEDGVGDDAFKALTREQAQALRERNPPLSPWRVVAAQAAAGVVSVALWWLLTQEGGKAWSALYGAAAVVVPNALLAWGMTRRPAQGAGAAVLGFMVWELAKILLTIAILVVVVKTVGDLSWLALLLTMVVCMKVHWLVLFRQGRTKNISDGN